ncbi:S-adenosyl-L-methionine-dependent methyltransferase, partial [Diaporthe sp. PMI_573]
MDLGESQVVELKEPVRVGRYCAEFVEIHEIWVPNKGDQVLIRGRTYARTRNLEGRIEPRKNEVSEIYELDENDHRAADPRRYLEQALVEIPVQDVKTTRTLHKTNKAFPECRFDRVRYRTKAERENEAPLTCRWQMVLSYPDPRYRRQQRPIAGEVIRHYDQDDISKDRHRVPDSERRKAHEKIRGGSFIPNGAPEARPKASPIHLAPGQKYTVVDIFSGAGGYSKGAEMAGLKILAACDHWPRCCETYRQNFPDTELHQEDVYKFIEDMSTDLTRERLNVDILHFSPPCQTWSPAHTCEGKKDEENRATLFACEKIITIFKPRIFTVEQTFGLAQDRWIPNFNALLQGFTRHGYSVRWKVLHLVEYGLPQTRKRLVMFGAAPGEQIPDWPKPTHSKDPSAGQKPFVSAFKACSTLVEGEILHDVEGARPTNKAPWDSSKPLGRTITTSGGQSYHPSGLRDLTLRELAVFQGFPSTFVFIGKCIKKQIGNAFAPIVVKTLLKCIRVHLESFDGVTHQPPP